MTQINRPDTKRKAAASRNEHRGNRYGRSEEAREAVLQAADNLLVEIGFAAVTIEGIAARAGVGKQTIYRWWPSKTDVLLDAFLEDAEQLLIAHDSGNLRCDLRAQLRALAAFLGDSDAGAVLKALLGQAQHDENLAKRLRDKFLTRQLAAHRVALEKALNRDELKKDLDLDAAVEALLAPLYFRVLVLGIPCKPAFIDHLVDRFIASNSR